ncbi:hypothetical protein [Simiduia agarivorans]|uniref:Uncharacterized protein n=1 Tax=Simiduia agarivorans (strain DSM 21679 / JCM 13881 / BCRC 17597 / SA1) TaxID=1117647 RepID=K4KGL4_SIMAS|nr:hypothetical protein [Simiduia agarivorans]AFU97340.2 hypothetical protein M5M_00525 [Simiduia agarivorans SA1 = DSM 21679]
MSYNDTNYGLTVREIFHRHFGLSRLIYFAAGRLWLGFGEKGELLSAPDVRGYPDLSKLFLATYLDEDQLTYLQVLAPGYQPECMVLPNRRATA